MDLPDCIRDLPWGAEEVTTPVRDTKIMTGVAGSLADYSVGLKVRNNYLLTAMRQRGIETASGLSRATGVSLPAIYELLNLSKPALLKNGEWRPTLLKLGRFFNLPPEALVPSQHHEQALPFNRAEVEASLPELMAISDMTRDGQALLPDLSVGRGEALDMLDEALNKLPPRTERVIRLYYGMADKDKPMICSDIGVDIGVSMQRVVQILQKGTRNLQSIIGGMAGSDDLQAMMEADNAQPGG